MTKNNNAKHYFIIISLFLVLIFLIFALMHQKSERTERNKILPKFSGTQNFIEVDLNSYENADGTEDEQIIPTITDKNEPRLNKYIEVVDGCGPHYEGSCVNVRKEPSTESPIVYRLRTGVVLKVAKTVTDESGREWHKISFDEAIRYRERITSGWYVSADVVHLLENEGELIYNDKTDDTTDQPQPSTNKRIIVDRSDQKLYAYDGDVLFMEQSISTGKDLTPTPRGNFKVYKKTPSRYMQGPLPGISDQYYDLPGVPWNLYFTLQGGVIHGAYWHDKFGEQWSHGCVNLPPEKAEELYHWAENGTPILVRD